MVGCTVAYIYIWICDPDHMLYCTHANLKILFLVVLHFDLGGQIRGGLKNVGCGIFRPQKCGMSVFREVVEGFFGKIDVGFFDQKYVGCGFF